jgi:hypothetical protein
MIAFGKSYAYSVMGRKVDEILQFLHQEFDYTYIKEEKDFPSVRESLKKKVEELNKKYPKTVKYYVRLDKGCKCGFLRIGQPGFATKGISLPYWNVREYKEEGGEV